MTEKNLPYLNFGGVMDLKQQNDQVISPSGFGRLGDNYAQQDIDLNEQLIKNRPATFFLRMNSHSMIGAGIHLGDILIVDRSLGAGNGKIVIAVVDNELLVRKLELNNSRTRLVPANGKLSPIDVNEKRWELWGVVTYVIHNVWSLK
jgi:DNA polymerase V